jgi:glutamate-1-semialdehyde aminotransferase
MTVLTQEAMVRALEYIPEGSFTLSKRPDAFPSQGSPRFAARGQGPYVIDDKGVSYLDWICGLGALTVGHTHPHVIDAVIKQVRDGAIYSLPSVLEGQVAERLCGLIPCAEQVKVVKTGSEACAAAVRIARAATGREKIVKFKDHYHGWHDWTMVTSAKHPGVPDSLLSGILEIHKDFDFDEAAGLPAAFICEPERLLLNGFDLPRLMDVAREHGVLIIFDETLSGGRLRLGGAQEMIGLYPDLAVFGKAFGGGYPFAFVCGKREYMQHAWPVSGTFSGDAIGLTAANAMLDVFEEPNHNGLGASVIDTMWSVGQRLWEALETKAKAVGLPLNLGGNYPRFWIKDFGPDIDRRQAMSVFVQICAAWGVLVHQAVIFASAAMTEPQIERSIDAMTHAVNEIHHHVMLRGEPYKDSVR